jgi:hypothetical protein
MRASSDLRDERGAEGTPSRVQALLNYGVFGDLQPLRESVVKTTDGYYCFDSKKFCFGTARSHPAFARTPLEVDNQILLLHLKGC